MSRYIIIKRALAVHIGSQQYFSAKNEQQKSRRSLESCSTPLQRWDVRRCNNWTEAQHSVRFSSVVLCRGFSSDIHGVVPFEGPTAVNTSKISLTLLSFILFFQPLSLSNTNESFTATALCNAETAPTLPAKCILRPQLTSLLLLLLSSSSSTPKFVSQVLHSSALTAISRSGSPYRLA